MDICLDMDICLEISTLVGTPLSQRGAVMRATMSFFFPKSKKLVVAVIPWYILSTRWLWTLRPSQKLPCVKPSWRTITSSRPSSLRPVRKKMSFSWYGFFKHKKKSICWRAVCEPLILSNHADVIEPNRHSSCHWPQWSHWRAIFSGSLWEISEYYR